MVYLALLALRLLTTAVTTATITTLMLQLVYIAAFGIDAVPGEIGLFWLTTINLFLLGWLKHVWKTDWAPLCDLQVKITGRPIVHLVVLLWMISNIVVDLTRTQYLAVKLLSTYLA